MSDIHFVEALEVRPGDKVLLRVDPKEVAQDVVERLGRLLNERYPDVEFTVLAVPGQLLTVRADD